MEAFSVSTPLQDILDPYPNAEQVRGAALCGGESAKLAIARLWLSEGIPYAFKNCPGLYESMRSWLGSKLNVDPKEISVTGSARLGQSLSPGKVGKPFGSDSDLDIFVVSELLFREIKNDFDAWAFDFESGIVKPLNGRERRFWEDNNKRGPRLLHRGFIDSKLVPNHSKYLTAKSLAQTMWLLKEKLRVTPKAPLVSHASVRVYRSWNDYVRQMIISFS